MIKLPVVVLILVVATETVTAKEKCDKTKLLKCNKTFQKIVLAHLHNSENIQEEQYCRDVQLKEDCKEAIENCHDKIPLFKSLYLYVNLVCSDKKEVYTANAQCMQQKKVKFEKCEPEKHEEEDFLKVICREVDKLQCEADVTKKECDNGEALGNAIEHQIYQLGQDCKAYSSGCAGVFVHHVWLLSIVLLGFLVSCKF